MEDSCLLLRTQFSSLVLWTLTNKLSEDTAVQYPEEKHILLQAAGQRLGNNISLYIVKIYMYSPLGTYSSDPLQVSTKPTTPTTTVSSIFWLQQLFLGKV